MVVPAAIIAAVQRRRLAEHAEAYPVDFERIICTVVVRDFSKPTRIRKPERPEFLVL
jgi:hypothetical protein